MEREGWREREREICKLAKRKWEETINYSKSRRKRERGWGGGTEEMDGCVGFRDHTETLVIRPWGECLCVSECVCV